MRNVNNDNQNHSPFVRAQALRQVAQRASQRREQGSPKTATFSQFCFSFFAVMFPQKEQKKTKKKKKKKITEILAAGAGTAYFLIEAGAAK